MINRVALIITDFLCKNETIKEEDRDIYIYGYEIFISNMINFLIVFIIGLLFHRLDHAAIFYISFVVTRSYCGGYHASTYTKCFFAFIAVFTTTLVTSELLLPGFNLFYIIMFLAIYISCIIEYAPIENINKDFTKGESKKHRKTSIILSICWTVLVFVFYFMAIKYAVTLTLTLVMVAMLMFIEINKRKECLEC